MASRIPFEVLRRLRPLPVDLPINIRMKLLFACLRTFTVVRDVVFRAITILLRVKLRGRTWSRPTCLLRRERHGNRERR